ncbi:MAG TPA: SMC-Scp complex subunit ScpB, partial [Candidatus Brocadiia bacterium]|nr:SMC-Scp complex subunit ScpB [Candidatus Brocadiia bacterium]
MSREEGQDAKTKAVLEALLVAADQPVSAARLAAILGRGVDTRKVRKLIEALRGEYDAQGRAFQIEEIAEGFQILTRPEYHDWVAELRRGRREERLTASAVETLAIVAFKQPVLRAEVDDIRGVHCGPILRALMEKNLIKIVGRKDVPGRPLLYGTSRRFLEVFGLKSLRELPELGQLPAGVVKPPPPEPAAAAAPAAPEKPAPKPEPEDEEEEGGE